MPLKIAKKFDLKKNLNCLKCFGSEDMIEILMENIESVNNEMRVNSGEALGDEVPSSYEFRCSKCAKLYRVDSKSILSSKPQFECLSCHSIFMVEIPSVTSVTKSALPSHSLTSAQVNRLQEKQIANQIRRSAVRNGELKTCPKCQTLNPRL